MTLKPSLRDELEGLRSRVSGHLLAPGDTGFDEARAVWNAMIDRRPAAIVRASAVDDIAPTIALARERGLDLAVRGGGHNVAGNGTVEGGIVLDLGDLNAVTVDPASRTVRCRAGPRWRTSTPPLPTSRTVYAAEALTVCCPRGRRAGLMLFGRSRPSERPVWHSLTSVP